MIILVMCNISVPRLSLPCCCCCCWQKSDSSMPQEGHPEGSLVSQSRHYWTTLTMTFSHLVPLDHKQNKGQQHSSNWHFLVWPTSKFDDECKVRRWFVWMFVWMFACLHVWMLICLFAGWLGEECVSCHKAPWGSEISVI